VICISRLANSQRSFTQSVCTLCKLSKKYLKLIPLRMLSSGKLRHVAVVKNLRFGATYRLHNRVKIIGELGKALAVTSNRSKMRSHHSHRSKNLKSYRDTASLTVKKNYCYCYCINFQSRTSVQTSSRISVNYIRQQNIWDVLLKISPNFEELRLLLCYALWFLQKSHGVISQKMSFFIVTAVKSQICHTILLGVNIFS
jgi:hypothetical protein